MTTGGVVVIVGVSGVAVPVEKKMYVLIYCHITSKLAAFLHTQMKIVADAYINSHRETEAGTSMKKIL